MKLASYVLIILLLNACGANIETKRIAANNAAIKKLELGVAYLLRGQNDKALEPLQKALNINPNYADAHNAIAVLYERLGKNNEAKKHYEKSLEIKPNYYDAHNNYGQFLCKNDEFAQANIHFLKAIENPAYKTPEVAYTNAGICAVRYKKLTDAETYIRKALQSNSKFPRALFQMASISFDQERYKQARDYLQRYSNVAKHTSKTLWFGFNIERKLNNKEAQVYYARLLRNQFPDALETQKLNQLEQ
jgi:type IV pilus assembly protein PilF